MDKKAEWIEDLLGAAKDTNDPQAIKLLEGCGWGCAMRKNTPANMEQLRQAAANCKTRSDYAAFLNELMPVRIEEAEDGIVMHLGKTECSCPVAKDLTQNTEMLCECTRGHEITTWSAFFGKPIEIEIVESILRGGNDCVIKIKLEETV